MCKKGVYLRKFFIILNVAKQKREKYYIVRLKIVFILNRNINQRKAKLAK